MTKQARLASFTAALCASVAVVMTASATPASAQSAQQPLVATISVPIKIGYLPLQMPYPKSVSCAVLPKGAVNPQTDTILAYGETTIPLVTTAATTTTAGYRSFSGMLAVSLYAMQPKGVPVSSSTTGATPDQALAANAIDKAGNYSCQLQLIGGSPGTLPLTALSAGTVKPQTVTVSATGTVSK